MFSAFPTFFICTSLNVIIVRTIKPIVLYFSGDGVTYVRYSQDRLGGGGAEVGDRCEDTGSEILALRTRQGPICISYMLPATFCPNQMP